MKDDNAPLVPTIVDEAKHNAQSIRAEIVDEVYIINNSGSLVGVEITAVAALILSICSWIFLPVIGSLAALFIAPTAKRKIRQSNGQLTGTNLAVIAQVISTLNLAASILVIYGIIKLLHWLF